MKMSWRSCLRVGVCINVSVAVALLGFPVIKADAQGREEIEFELRTGPMPFIFPPGYKVRIGLRKAYFGSACQDVPKISSVKSSIPGQQEGPCPIGGQEGACLTPDGMVATGSVDGSAIVTATCTTPDNRVLQRTKLIEIRAGAPVPPDASPYGLAANVPDAPQATTGAGGGAGEASASGGAGSSASDSSAAGTALGVAGITAGIVAVAAALAAAAGGGGGAGSNSGSGATYAGSWDCLGQQQCAAVMGAYTGCKTFTSMVACQTYFQGTTFGNSCHQGTC